MCTQLTLEESVLVWHLGKNRNRWIQSDQVITQWLQERQRLLVTYYEVCSQRKVDTAPDHQLLQSLCQLLMDYVSMGHFRVFEHLAVAQASCSTKYAELDRTLLDKILQSTEIALDFNDSFEENQMDETFYKRLSLLGQHLAHRMDFEDKLIQNYLNITDGILTPSSAA